MEPGLTFPLQRFLYQKPLPYGSESDRRFCWDLHVIELRGRTCLLAVHCHSRYTFVRFDVPGLLWADLPTLFRTGLSDSLTAAGFAPEQIVAYLQASGEVRFTRTHGRRVVAFLNRAWKDVLALDTASTAHPILDWAKDCFACAPLYSPVASLCFCPADYGRKAWDFDSFRCHF